MTLAQMLLEDGSKRTKPKPFQVREAALRGIDGGDPQKVKIDIARRTHDIFDCRVWKGLCSVVSRVFECAVRCMWRSKL